MFGNVDLILRRAPRAENTPRGAEEAPGPFRIDGWRTRERKHEDKSQNAGEREDQCVRDRRGNHDVDRQTPGDCEDGDQKKAAANTKRRGKNTNAESNDEQPDIGKLPLFSSKAYSDAPETSQRRFYRDLVVPARAFSA